MKWIVGGMTALMFLPVLFIGAAFGALAQPGSGNATQVVLTSPSEAGNAAVSYALDQLGVPYRWGGDGPGGFDCSGLTQAAYAAGGIRLPRVAQDQYNVGRHLPAGTPLVAGDLVFFGSDTNHVTHVGIMLNGTEMIDAPHTGAVVRIEDYRWSDYLGATRPWNG